MRLLEQLDANWTTIAPYLDTICLPVYQYQMVHKELQLEEASLIEYITDELEKRLIGRMLLLPAYNLIGKDEQLMQNAISGMGKELAHSGFHYRFLVILEGTWGGNQLNSSFYLLTVQKNVDRDAELERLYGEILHIWQSV